MVGDAEVDEDDDGECNVIFSEVEDDDFEIMDVDDDEVDDEDDDGVGTGSSRRAAGRGDSTCSSLLSLDASTTTCSLPSFISICMLLLSSTCFTFDGWCC